MYKKVKLGDHTIAKKIVAYEFTIISFYTFFLFLFVEL